MATKNLATVPNIAELTEDVSFIGELKGDINRVPYSLIREKIEAVNSSIDSLNKTLESYSTEITKLQSQYIYADTVEDLKFFINNIGINKTCMCFLSANCVRELTSNYDVAAKGYVSKPGDTMIDISIMVGDQTILFGRYDTSINLFSYKEVCNKNELSEFSNALSGLQEIIEDYTTDIDAATQNIQTNSTAIAANAEQIDQLKSDLNELSNMKSGAIVQTVSGESIVTNDSSDDPLRGLRVFGKTEQFTTTGAQLFDVSKMTTQSSGGLTSVFNADGSITVNGTPTTQYAIASTTTYLTGLEPGTYYISGGSTKGGCVVAQINRKLSDETTKHTSNGAFTVDGTETYIRLNIQTMSAGLEPVNNYTIYPMLNKGETALPWEPYTGGIPSPNPQYTQDLVSVGDDGDVEVGVNGGNLLDYNEWSNKTTCFPPSSTLEWKDNGATITSVTADAYTSYSASGDNVYKVPCKPNTTYTLSWEWSGNEQDRVYVFFNGANDRNKNSLSSTKKLTFTTPEDTTFFTFRFGCYVAGTTSVYKNAQINLGDVVLPFEPYHKQSLTALTPNGLHGIKLGTIIPDVIANSAIHMSGVYWNEDDDQYYIADTIDFDRGVYVNRIFHETFDGSDDEGWIDNSCNIGSRYIFYADRTFIASDTTTGVSSCNSNFPIAGKGNTYTQPNLYTITYDGIFVSLNGNETLDEFKAYLAAKPMTVSCLYETPIETPLSEEELTAYRALHTNYPVTTVLNDSGANMEVKYKADTKNYIDNKFTELTNAILSMGGNV